MTKVPSIGIINSRASSGSSRASILFNMDLRCRKYLDVSSCVITLQCCRKFSSQDLCAAGSSRVANIAGNCVCSQDSTEIQGTCVKLSLLVPCIVTPLFVIGLMAAWYYHEASFLLIPMADILAICMIFCYFSFPLWFLLLGPLPVTAVLLAKIKRCKIETAALCIYLFALSISVLLDPCSGIVWKIISKSESQRIVHRGWRTLSI